MLYKFLYFPARVGLWFYCRKIVINRKEMLDQPGPLLIAANHPNSFLDAIILSSLMKHPVHSLARGDAFSGPLFSRLLRALNMLPVYRVSEGVENLEHNYTTFDACLHLFAQSQIVLIFSEGRCINEWHLRPLKKGTARLSFAAWTADMPVKVLPLGINYSSFKKFGKVVHLNFGEIITPVDITEDITTGKAIVQFNALLADQLKGLVYEIDEKDHQKLKQHFGIKSSFFQKAILVIPAIVGYILHAPLYYAAHLIIKDRAKDHYDSVMVSILLLFYPLYLLLITGLTWWLTANAFALFLLILVPLMALCLLHFRDVINR